MDPPLKSKSSSVGCVPTVKVERVIERVELLGGRHHLRHPQVSNVEPELRTWGIGQTSSFGAPRAQCSSAPLANMRSAPSSHLLFRYLTVMVPVP